MHDKYKDKGLVVLGLSIDRTDIEPVKQYVEELNLTFPTLHDPTAQSGVNYGIRGVPTTFFINQDGKVLGFVIGPRQWDSVEVERLVEHLLTEVSED